MSLAWIAQQIQAAQEAGAFRTPQLIAFNPRPPGVAIEGSATTEVRKFLAKHATRWFTHAEIMRGVNAHKQGNPHGRAAVDWALIRLRSWDLIETVPDDARNSLWLRYRIKPTNQVKE